VRFSDRPDGTKTSFAYDAFGRRTSVAQGDIKESVEFDDAGRVKARVSPDGSRTAFSFNKQGQLASVARDGKAVVEFLHDAQGRVTGEKDPLGRIKKVERDIRGNLVSETAPNGSVNPSSPTPTTPSAAPPRKPSATACPPPCPTTPPDASRA